MTGILKEIVAGRLRRLSSEGRAEGVSLPKTRALPLVPFGRPPFVICEIKRKSPSRGDIAPSLDAVSQASSYAAVGIKSVSVLTEPEHFGGSLGDLIAVKRAFPYLSVLRKDFLIDVADIDISYRAGADAVLLIASILRASDLAEMYRRTRELGMRALVEIHADEDVAKIASLHPDLVGINSRDLETFIVDICAPLKLMKRVTWEAELVFESGIRSSEDAAFASSAGFHGILVGEAAVRDQSLASDLVKVFADQSGNKNPILPGRENAAPAHRRGGGFFWERLFRRYYSGKPLVKICGITREGDAELAASLGADILGFVFASSLRRARPSVVTACSGLPVLKVAVVALEEGASLPDEVRELLDRGLIDAVQFHGHERAEDCFKLAFPYYKAVGVRSVDDLKDLPRSPRVLIDARTERGSGGSGVRIPDYIVKRVGVPLWLAGGLDAENVGAAIARHVPELVDVSSGIEKEPGIKDAGKLRAFMKAAGRQT